ncbi:DUF924 family protein [Rosenbergiella epipactidis]|uniref:DUF924 family protein n=1 Tax=Rosenbergiella epipactidis TaxID=1544694 RepID=UPI001F4D512C
MTYRDVISFWFDPEHQQFWFRSSDEFDQLIRQKFESLWLSACKCELFQWRKSASGRLAEIIVLDQFSRNLNRGSDLAFRQDGMALMLSQELISQKSWYDLTPIERGVSLLPWMHSESLAIHEEAIALFEMSAEPKFLQFETQHCELIRRFGRYPYRNVILGRDSTADEIEWLKHNNSF